LATVVTILFIGGGLDEFGWRGCALGGIRNGKNALIASLVLGYFWGATRLLAF